MITPTHYLEDFNQLLLPLINKVQRLADRSLERSLKQLDLTLSEFRILGLLMGEELGHSQKQLAAKLGISPPSLSVAIAKLEKKDLVRRIEDSIDQRIKRIQLSPQLNLEAIANVIADLEQDATESINKRDLQTTRRVLAQILVNITPPSHREDN